MKFKKALKILLIVGFVIGVAWQAQAAGPAEGIPMADQELFSKDSATNSEDQSPSDTPAAAYSESFPDPLSQWRSGWFFTNTNAESYYYANSAYDCDPDYRGNQPDGIWISDDRGRDNLVVQSPVRIDFLNNFGDNATLFSLDQFTCTAGVTFKIYDKNGTVVVSEALPSDCWNWSNYSYPLSNGISAFEYEYTDGQVEGNTSIDNVVLDVTSPWDICVKDVLYITEYQFNVEAGNVMRGMAYATSPSFPAPITGTYNPSNNHYSFTIGYLNDNSRHYWISGSSGAGYSWGILGSDSSFFQTPRGAQLGGCPAQSAESVEGKTGDYR